MFTPNASFSGTASFVYTLRDGSLTDTATVTLAVGKTFNGGNGKDTFMGTAGDDIINGGNGADLLTGGAGRDKFILNKSAGGDIITDFADGFDVIGLSGRLSVGQLTISASGSNTLVKLGCETLASLIGVNSSLITAADFVTV